MEPLRPEQNTGEFKTAASEESNDMIMAFRGADSFASEITAES